MKWFWTMGWNCQASNFYRDDMEALKHPAVSEGSNIYIYWYIFCHGKFRCFSLDRIWISPGNPVRIWHWDFWACFLWTSGCTLSSWARYEKQRATFDCRVFNVESIDTWLTFLFVCCYYDCGFTLSIIWTGYYMGWRPQFLSQTRPVFHLCVTKGIEPLTVNQ